MLPALLIASAVVAQPAPLSSCGPGERLMRARAVLDGGQELEELHCVAVPAGVAVGPKAKRRAPDGGVETVEQFRFIPDGFDVRMQRWLVLDGGALVIQEDVAQSDAGTLREERYDALGRLSSVRTREPVDGGPQLGERFTTYFENGVRATTRVRSVDALTPLAELEPAPAPDEAFWPDGCLSESTIVRAGAAETTWTPRCSARAADGGVPLVMIDAASSRITSVSGDRASWPKELRHQGGTMLSVTQGRTLGLCFGKTKVCHDGVYPSAFSVTWSAQGRFAVVTGTEKDGANTVFDFQRRTHRGTTSSRFAGPSELIFEDGTLLDPATGEKRKTSCDAASFVRRLPDDSLICARMSGEPGVATWTRERGAKSTSCTSRLRWRLASGLLAGPFAMQVDEASVAACGEVFGDLLVRVAGLDAL